MAVGMIFDAPLLQFNGLFRRALYHGRALNERGQPEACQKTCETAFSMLDTLRLKDNDRAMLKIALTAQLAAAIAAQDADRAYARATARGVIESVDIKALRSLPLKDRWFYHHVAAGLIGGTHKSLATRGCKMVLGQDLAKSRGPISDARMLLALLAQEI